ncbi:DHA2 family efflux MFS transporter permease subunit [Echinicola vietnamensis]|uniref:Drug resistance transporter, EmrB/QacA subfamily n=1 Tax=Echinicola vietnamensis (strain DSM 17526 / LMG 23754 / KMM 6221) TaxID=926556 RepID=L0G557_ECHVK|nr:DHA2 family efflux MFS transporter permease subunit [Echinicola vietnamensis]AGA80677.1 drug resistance transporter, EmrB/QacA subfamily [Echinicola vietnamensis DSM 17526]
MEKKSLYISLIVGIAFLMENLDSTAITTAIPKMANDFSVSSVTMSTGITAYVIMLAVFIPISGWVADRYGTRSVFSLAVTGFILASVACGFSGSLPVFVVSRILQGMAGAMMVPVGQLAVLTNTAKEDLVAATAYITWPGLVGPIAGPFLGGFFTSYLSWHWIFFINVPIGIITIIYALKFIPNSLQDTTKSKRKLDWIGFLLSGIGLMCLTIGLELLSQDNVDYTVSFTLIGISLLLIGLSVWHSFRTEYPIMDYNVLKIKTFRIPITSGTISKIVINTAPFIIPLLFQTVFGMSAFHSGLLFMASMIGNLMMKPATIWITKKYNFRQVLCFNGFLLALTTFLQVFFYPGLAMWIIAGILFFAGMVRSMQFSGLNTLAYADVPPDLMNNANTLYITLQQLSVALGVSFAALSLHFSAFYHQNGNNYQLNDFQMSFTIISLFCLLSLIGYLKLNKEDGWVVRVKNK